MQEFGHEFSEAAFYYPSLEERQWGVWPVIIGRNKAKPNYRVGPKRIAYYSLHIVFEGQLLFMNKNRDQIISLQQGDLFCMFPHEVYEYEIAALDQSLKLGWLAIDGPRALFLLELLGLRINQPTLRGIASQGLYTTFNQLFAHIQQNKPQSGLRTLSLIHETFHQLLKPIEDGGDHNVVKPGWVEKSGSFMDMHYKENVSVNQVAAWAGISRAHFSKYFTYHMGITPSKWIEKKRMEEAKRLLAITKHSITEIALTLGFNDLYMFTRAFKKYEGIPPRTYRQSMTEYRG